jgi:Phasin protein
MSDLNRIESNARRSDPAGALASVLHQAEAWTSAQGALLSRAETLWADWLHRRRDAIAAASGSLQAMCDCHSLGELVRIQQRWVAGAIERSAADAEALVSIPLALSETTTRTPARTAEVTIRPVRQGKTAPTNVVEAPNQQVAAE